MSGPSGSARMPTNGAPLSGRTRSKNSPGCGICGQVAGPTGPARTRSCLNNRIYRVPPTLAQPSHHPVTRPEVPPRPVQTDLDSRFLTRSSRQPGRQQSRVQAVAGNGKFRLSGPDPDLGLIRNSHGVVRNRGSRVVRSGSRFGIGHRAEDGTGPGLERELSRYRGGFWDAR